MSKNETTIRNFSVLPVIPIKDMVLFPKTTISIFIGRESSVKALECSQDLDNQLIMVAQKRSATEDPEPEDLHSVGVVVSITQQIKVRKGVTKVVVRVLDAVRLHDIDITEQDFMVAEYELLFRDIKAKEEIKARLDLIRNLFDEYVNLNKELGSEFMGSLNDKTDIDSVIGIVMSSVKADLNAKQKILEQKVLDQQLNDVASLIQANINLLELEQELNDNVKKQLFKNQKEYFLNEKLRAIHNEIGDGGIEDTSQLENKIQALKAHKSVKERALAELDKLKMMNQMSSEAGIIRNYIDWIVSLPWQHNSRIVYDVSKVTKILDTNHHCLTEVKERLLEYLAVQKRVKKNKGSIICLVGPPGVGKTSITKSLAKASGRKYMRISLGGVHDESEIRGHRKTYVGAMPGRIIQSLKRIKTSNPLILLDEIDKMTRNMHGDPASALLEVLDPEQNESFYDHFLDMDYDLSNIMFVATSNSTSQIPVPLLDRMEIIKVSGYTEEEKFNIARNFLIPKQFKSNGVKEGECNISDGVILDLIRHYTRESGVRSLQREIDKITRKVLTEILSSPNKKKVAVTTKNHSKYSGVKKYSFGIIEQDNQVAIVKGLAYTEVGGDLLTIESVIAPGKGKFNFTGKLGEVMQESSQIAFSLIKANSQRYKIDEELFAKKDVHLHFPEGATPKDGPSAGIAICTCIISLLANIAIHKDIAMTGEITLRGKVLPIGGLKEKLLAALRGGIKKVLIPTENSKDLEELPDNVKKGLNIVQVSNLDEVLKHALVKDIFK